MVLGLPKEPRADAGTWAELQRTGLMRIVAGGRCAARACGRPALRQWATARARGLVAPPAVPAGPDRRYLGFRLQTQYGEPRHRPATADVVTYLTWCRDWQDVTA